MGTSGPFGLGENGGHQAGRTLPRRRIAFCPKDDARYDGQWHLMAMFLVVAWLVVTSTKPAAVVVVDILAACIR